MQIIRIDGLAKAATITKLFMNPTQQLSASVKGVVRFNRIVDSKTIAKLLPKTGYTWDGFLILTPDTELSPDTELVI